MAAAGTPDGGEETGAKLGRDGVPAQCQLQALWHRAPAGGEHRRGGNERIANSVCAQGIRDT